MASLIVPIAEREFDRLRADELEIAAARHALTAAQRSLSTRVDQTLCAHEPIDPGVVIFRGVERRGEAGTATWVLLLEQPEPVPTESPRQPQRTGEPVEEL